MKDEASAFLDALNEDSRFSEVDAEWASCMADAGLTETSPSAAEQRFVEEFVAATAEGQLPDQEVVDARAAEERRVAVADFDCRGRTDWTARHRAIEVELQQEYVDAHRADLEALVAALEPVVSGG